MSRRRNGTNRAQTVLNVSRFVGYGKPKKVAVDADMLNRKMRGEKNKWKKEP